MPELPTPEGSPTGLTRTTLTGLQWSYIGSAVAAVLQLGMAAVMARLLTPAAFGLVALAGLFLRFVDHFAKAGISQALIQKPRLSTFDIRAAFTLSVGLSSTFALIVLLAAPLAGDLAQDPDLVPVLQWLTLGLVMQGLGAPATALLRRDLRFKFLAQIEVGSYILGYTVVGLAMALAGAGVYALVAAMLVQMAVRAVGAYLATRHPILPTAATDSYRSIFSFGARISIIGFLEFLQANLDTLAVGRSLGAAPLGIYNRAKLIGELPGYQLTRGLAQVLFPSFSAIQSELARLRKAYISSVGGAAAIILPLNAGMAVAAPEIVLVLLGPKWVDAIPVLPWLLLASSLTLLGHFAGIVAEAQARLNAKLIIAVTSTCTLVLLLYAADGHGLPAFGAAVAGTALVTHLGYVSVLTRSLQTTLLTLTQPYLRAGLGAAAVAAVIAAARLLLTGIGSPIGLTLAVEVLGGGLTLVLLLRFGPMRPYRDDFARRLADAGVYRNPRSRLARTAGFVVGPPLGD
jgi:lipopolysaccharide exporter